MRLSEVVIETKPVPLSDQEGDHFDVRGINLNDLMRLAFTQSDAMRRLYEEVMARVKGDGGEFTTDEVKAILMDSVKDAPDLVFRAIAFAADEPDEWDKVRKLPLVVQLDALEKIALLSLRSDAELKKLQEIIVRLIEWTTGIFLNVTTVTPSIGGSGKSARK